MIKFFFYAAMLFISSACLAQTSWKIESATSKVKFEIGGPLGTTCEGSFAPPTGTLKFDPAKLSASLFDITLNVASLDTDNKKRDAHLKKEEFFYVEKYPNIFFKSEKIEKTASGFVATGTLKIKERSKTVQIPFTMVPQGKNGIFKGTITINRLDFGVGTSSYLVKDMAKVMIEIVAGN